LTTLAITVPDWTTLAISIVVGLATGCVYALVALAFNLVLAASGVFNLVTGAMITGSVILTFVFTAREGLPFLVVAVIVMALGGIAGSLSELISVRRMLRDARSLSHETMVSTLALGLGVSAVAALWFGNNIYPVRSYVSSRPVLIGSVPVQPVYLVMPVVVLLVAVVVELVLKFTQFGVVTRAVIADPEGASLVGIRVSQIVQYSFIAAGMMAALAGFLIAPVVSASAFVGDSVMMYGFAAIAIGGFGSFRGTVVGGLIVGLVVGVSPAFLDPNWSSPLVYGILVLILFMRPAGLFGRRGQFGAMSTRQV
jgi:branched-chain amino acid transport system permease protein